MITISEDFLKEMQRAVRVNSTETSNQEVTALIHAGAAELKRRGIYEINLDEALTKQAVKLYCKGNYGYDKDHERFMNAFDRLADAMSLSGEYSEAGDQDG